MDNNQSIMHILQSKLKKKPTKIKWKNGGGCAGCGSAYVLHRELWYRDKKKYPRQLWLFVSLIKLRNKLKVTDSIVILSLQDNITLIDWCPHYIVSERNTNHRKNKRNQIIFPCICFDREVMCLQGIFKLGRRRGEKIMGFSSLLNI